MKLYNTQDKQIKPPLVMLIYGDGGVGKTTFASTAPKPILADCEGGAKYFGLRGINMDVAQIQVWGDMREFLEISKNYETVVIDPIGELMDKLKQFMVSRNDSKLVQKDGAPTMAGWGYLKKTMRDYLKLLRDSGKNVIIVAHVQEERDEDRIVKRPKIETKLSDELVNMVDVVAYMTVISDNGEEKRILRVDPSSDKIVAKDRTGQLGKVIPPNFMEIVEACQGTKKFKWSKEVIENPKEVPTKPKEEEKPQEEQKPKQEEKNIQVEVVAPEEDNVEDGIAFDIKDNLLKETIKLLQKLPKEKLGDAKQNVINSGQFNEDQIKKLKEIK